MWDHLALALATAARIQRRIDSDRPFRSLLTESPIALSLTPAGSLGLERAEPPITTARRDSITDRLGNLGPGESSPAIFYTIELGRAMDRSQKEKLLRRLRSLGKRRVQAGWDSTMTLDWIHRDCNVGDWDRPVLFVLSTKPGGRVRYSVSSGMYFARQDAEEAGRRVSAEFGLPVAVKPVAVTGELLKSVFPPI